MKAGQDVRLSGQITGTNDRDSLARAHPSFGGDVPVVPRDSSGGTQDSVAGQGQPCAEATGSPSPFVTAEVRRQEDKRRLMADPRFALWAAGQPVDAK